MPVIAILAGALVATSLNVEHGLERIDVAYSELASGNAAAAVERMSTQRRTDDPTVLINLAAAHTRLGHFAEARQLLKAAVASPDRYDVELADGRWMDSRNAARLGLVRLDGSYSVQVF